MKSRNSVAVEAGRHGAVNMAKILPKKKKKMEMEQKWSGGLVRADDGWYV